MTTTDPLVPTLRDDPIVPTTLTRRELWLIVGFWVAFGAVLAVGRLADPRGPGLDSPQAVAFAGSAMVQALVWAVLTPVLFVVVGRLDTERGDRLPAFALLVAAAIVAGLLVHLAGNLARAALLPDDLPPFGGRRGGGGPRVPGMGPPFRRPWSPWRVDRFGIVNDLITAAAVLAAAVARDASMRFRAREEQAQRLQAQLAEARLDALRRQLDPHFLFNTLNAVSALVERDPRGVRRMIARLGELLRHSMEGGDEQEVPLERELQLLQLYVDIMQVRFQGKLVVEMDVDPHARAALVPNLVLQPLVENAIRHGVSQAEGRGRVVVRAVARGDELVLRVEDDGPGPSGAPAPASDAGGVGLRNTRERLARLYGTRQRFSLGDGVAGGAVAELAIPFHVAPAADAAARTA